MSSIIRLRNSLFNWSYVNLLRPVFFTQDPEKMHRLFISVGRLLGSNPITRGLTSACFNYHNPILNQKIAGITFSNPVGLSAGFDKNAEMIKIMPCVGFGFTEVGSITALPCEGNPGDRLARIPEKKSLWVNFGLNNHGAEYLSEKIKNITHKIPVGVNVAKTNCKATTDPKTGREDYIFTLNKFRDIADYFTINISCPNAYGGQQFSEPKLFKALIEEIDKLEISKPIFIKISPDLSKNNIDEIIRISSKHNVAGFICTNLTKKHDLKYGGISGKPLEKLSNDIIKYVYKKTKGKYIIVGVGGVFSAEDAYRKIKLGASLVQLITSMIYEGPQVISQINEGLVKLLKADGYTNISQAVGRDVKM